MSEGGKFLFLICMFQAKQGQMVQFWALLVELHVRSKRLWCNYYFFVFRLAPLSTIAMFFCRLKSFSSQLPKPQSLSHDIKGDKTEENLYKVRNVLGKGCFRVFLEPDWGRKWCLDATRICSSPIWLSRWCFFAIKTVPLESMMEFLGSKISNREEQWKKFILDWRAWYWTRHLTCKEKALQPWFLQAKQLCAESEWFQRKDPLMKQNETWRYLELSICEPNISPIAIVNVFSL